MSRGFEKAKRAAGKRIEELEMRILANEGRRSLQTKVERAKRVTKKAVKAGIIAGAVAATMVVMRERKKQRKLNG